MPVVYIQTALHATNQKGTSHNTITTRRRAPFLIESIFRRSKSTHRPQLSLIKLTIASLSPERARTSHPAHMIWCGALHTDNVPYIMCFAGIYLMCQGNAMMAYTDDGTSSVMAWLRSNNARSTHRDANKWNR